MGGLFSEAFLQRPFCKGLFDGGLFEKAFLRGSLFSGRPFWCYPGVLRTRTPENAQLSSISEKKFLVSRHRYDELESKRRGL